MRRFDPADQRSTGATGAFTLMPASEALLDEDSIKRFRARYRETFGANATGDPLYQAVSEGRRLAGMEHWLPLFEDKLATPVRAFRRADVIVRDGGSDGALESRAEAIQDYYTNRKQAMVAEPGSYRPLAPSALYLAKKEVEGAIAERPIHLASTFPEPRQRQGHRLRRRGAARLRPRARAERQCLRSRRQARRQAAEGQEESRPRQLLGRRARTARRAARRPWPEQRHAGRQLAGGAWREEPTRR